MPEGFVKGCSRLVGQYICPALGILLSGIGGSLAYVYEDSNAQLENITAQVQETRETLSSMEGDLKVIRFRLDQAAPTRIVSVP